MTAAGLRVVCSCFRPRCLERPGHPVPTASPPPHVWAWNSGLWNLRGSVRPPDCSEHLSVWKAPAGRRTRPHRKPPSCRGKGGLARPCCAVRARPCSGRCNTVSNKQICFSALEPGRPRLGCRLTRRLVRAGFLVAWLWPPVAGRARELPEVSHKDTNPVSKGSALVT